MSSVRRAIKAFFFFFSFFLFFFSFLFSINVVISSFIECMSVESPFPPPFPQILCVCVCVCGWGGGWMCKRVSVYVSACMCLLYPSIFYLFFLYSSFCFG